MKKTFGAAALLFLIHVQPALTQQAQISDLKSLPPNRQVRSASYCKGVYSVTFKDGNSLKFPEFNLRFKTDGGANGPRPDSPVIVPSGMAGDRATLVFAGHAEISNYIKAKC